MSRPIILIFVGVCILSIAGCLNPFVREAERVDIGPTAAFSLVVYFDTGTTAAQVEAFNHGVLKEPADERGADFKEGIASYLRLTPDQGNGHWGFAITFYKETSEEQRAKIKEMIVSNELVYKVFENIAPTDIKPSDLE